MTFRRFVSARLHRQLFMWLGITILFTGMVVSAVVSALRPDASSMESDLVRIQRFIGERFQRVWDNPAERHTLAEDIGKAFEVDLTLRDNQQHAIDQVGAGCEKPQFSVPIPRGSQTLGVLEVCIDKRRRVPGITFVLAIAAACLSLWGASGALARKLVRPLSDLIRVTREIGSGNLVSRVRLGRHHMGEVGVLADSINDMAKRIERQLNDQRELLAAVSHEIRSPLARLRLLTELLRGSTADAGQSTLDKVEREIVEVDDLIGKLLASSRLDFGTLNLTSLEPCELVQRTIERAGLDPSAFHNDAPDTRIKGDPTLLDRAVCNLIENAQKHAGGVESVQLSVVGQNLRITVHDRGPGFAKEALGRVFDAFFRGDGSSSLGLGLALVERIARAHGGRAWAENRADGGASLHFEIPREQ